ncbi:MAG TPA: HD domain-containing protein [Selenomonadales bacterium]|nr:HD domain-containing protein [Selenomonadales bacterium]
MDLINLRKIQAWFDSYVSGYYTRDADVAPLIQLKEEHSRLVARHARELSGSLGLEEGEVRLAEALGLCHDVGRFKQAALYRTFKDKDSVDHGRLGADELRAAGLAGEFGPEEWDLFLFAVTWHNAASVPAQPREKWNLFAKIIRDADKLDIYRVLPPKPESDGCTPAILEAAVAGHLLRYEDLRTGDDKKLIMLNWVYDINFPWTIRQVLAEGYWERLWAALPPGTAVSNFRSRVEGHIAKKLETCREKVSV